LAIWQDKSRQDFARAIKAEAEGNQGLARVCARRAAGWAATAYLTQFEKTLVKPTGYENIQQLVNTDLQSVEARPIIARLTSNLETETAEGEEVWPADLNLISDAYRLIELLFPASNLKSD
jgi:ATP:corrinoid adenosyltransferase